MEHFLCSGRDEQRPFACSMRCCAKGVWRCSQRARGVQTAAWGHPDEPPLFLAELKKLNLATRKINLQCSSSFMILNPKGAEILNCTRFFFLGCWTEQYLETYDLREISSCFPTPRWSLLDSCTQGVYCSLLYCLRFDNCVNSGAQWFRRPLAFCLTWLKTKHRPQGNT